MIHSLLRSVWSADLILLPANLILLYANLVLRNNKRIRIHSCMHLCLCNIHGILHHKDSVCCHIIRFYGFFLLYVGLHNRTVIQHLHEPVRPVSLALFTRLMREHSELSELNDIAAAYRKLLDDIDAAREMLDDPDMAELAREELPALAGVPTAFKDNMNQLGTRTTCSSQMLANYESAYTATCVSP